jgi:hypothetical protein
MDTGGIRQPTLSSGVGYEYRPKTEEEVRIEYHENYNQSPPKQGHFKNHTDFTGNIPFYGNRK